MLQSRLEKCFLQDVRHNLWKILPGWGHRSGLWQLNSSKIYCKVGRADCGNAFSNTLWHTKYPKNRKNILQKLSSLYIINSFTDGFPSGQRGQTVNLLAMPSKVRILLHPFDEYNSSVVASGYVPMWLNWQSSWFVISRLSVRVRSSAFGFKRIYRGMEQSGSSSGS